MLDAPVRSPFDPGTQVTLLDTGKYDSPRDGGARVHRGRDLHVPIGTPVYAMADGVVHTFMPGRDGVITPGDGLGYAVQINGHGIRWTYGHFGPQAQNSQHLAFAPGIAPGVQVVAGQLLGWSGESGATASGPHLHIDWRDTSGLVDDDPFADYQATLGSEAGPRYDPSPTLARIGLG